MYDLIVIGGGPAGLTSTIYAIRKRLNVLLLSKDLGGKTNYRLALPWIQDYQVIRGLEIVNKFRSELEYLDFARKMESVEKVTKVGNHFVVETKSGEKLETKAGWNFASPDEDWVRGYPQELEDFVDCLRTGREPVSGLDLACQTVEAIYAAYLSAEKGGRVELKKRES